MNRFRIALSFPGEHRVRVERIAEVLASHFGRERILYDKWYAVEFNRLNLDTYLTSLYQHESDLIAVFLCKEYNAKEWCGLEWRACRDLLKHKQDDRLMFFRLDDADIPGLYSIDGYQDMRDMSDSEVAAALLIRAGQVLDVPDSPRPNSKGALSSKLLKANAALAEPDYVTCLAERTDRLQRERSFIDPWPASTQSARAEAITAPQKAAKLSPHGEVDPGIPSLRFSLQAKKLSVDELRKKYGGAELNYDDYIALVTSTGSAEINDVVEHIMKMPAGWAIQILGAPGIGKSFVLRQACIGLANSHEEFRLVPFYVELRDAPHEGFSSPLAVMEFIARMVSECTGQDRDHATDFTARILAEGRGVVFFDAIDEAGDPLEALRPITEFMRAQEHRANRYVFSCRTFDQVPGLVAEELVLLPLSYRSLRDYLRAALVNSPQQMQVENELRNTHLRRVLGTPLVASAYARFVRDRQRLPKTLYEALTDGMQKRFWAVAIQRELLPASATEEEFMRRYAPVADILRRLAYRMRNRMAPVWPSRMQRADTTPLESGVTSLNPLAWAEWAGVIYTTSEGRVAFCLHRYKELYLAEKWTKEYQRSGEWPEDVKDRVGRIMWTESLILLGDLVEDPEVFLRFLLTFCEEKYVSLSDIGLVDRYRLVEAIILTARMAASRCTNDGRRAIYSKTLLMVHEMAFDERIPLPDRLRTVRSLGTHARASSADILFAVHDDAIYIRDGFLRTSLQETALAAAAELIVNDALGNDRIDQFVRRVGQRALKKDVTSILSESAAAAKIMRQVEKQVRRTHARQAVWTVAVLFLIASSILVARSRGVAGVAVMLIAVLFPCASALFLLRMRALVSRGSEKSEEHERISPRQELIDGSPPGDLYADPTDGCLPYSPERFWIPKDETRMYWNRHALPTWTLATYRTALVSLVLLLITLIIAILQGTILYLLSIHTLAQILGILLSYAPRVLLVALAVGIGVYSFRYKAVRHRWKAAKAERERNWRERLQRVQEESERLRARDEDVDYIIDHLMEDVPFGSSGLGMVQARVEAIRRHMVSDSMAVERLRKHLDQIDDSEMKRLLWSVIEDMTRIHVIREEKELFAGSEGG